jgi:hypothetical protein
MAQVLFLNQFLLQMSTAHENCYTKGWTTSASSVTLNIVEKTWEILRKIPPKLCEIKLTQ